MTSPGQHGAPTRRSSHVAVVIPRQAARMAASRLPPGGTASRYIPLIALMPNVATRIEDPPDAAGEPALLPATHPPGDARPRRKWSRRHLLLQPAERRHAGGSCPAPPFIDHCGIRASSAPAFRHNCAAHRASGSSSSPSDVPSNIPATSASKSERPAASARSSLTAAASSSPVSGRHLT